VPAVPAPGRPSLPKSGAEARVKRPNHLQTLKFTGTWDALGCRLTRGARLRYPGPTGKRLRPKEVNNLRPDHPGRQGAR
jgi:hypothetical protein